MKNIFILTFAILITACGTSTKKEALTEASDITTNVVTLSDAQLKSAKLVLAKLEEKALSSLIITNGTIDVPPQNMISVSIPLGGYLKSTKLLPGLNIRKGEVIAVIEDQQYIQLQQDYLTIKARLAFSKAEFDRQKELNASKASSDKVFQQIQMEYNTQRISLSALEQKLRMVNINPASISESTISRTIPVYSPINGFVSKVNIEKDSENKPISVNGKNIVSIRENKIVYAKITDDGPYPCSFRVISIDPIKLEFINNDDYQLKYIFHFLQLFLLFYFPNQYGPFQYLLSENQ